MEINDDFLGFMVVVRMEINIHSEDYLNAFAKPKARRAMEVGPQS